ncbi:MAG: hypothetical protein KF688_07395 [Pirellulales bacterium]|nr:hypothetical protein [Pirellulales bacterium]
MKARERTRGVPSPGEAARQAAGSGSDYAGRSERPPPLTLAPGEQSGAQA